MPEWLFVILTSEFLWGIVTGILLATYGAFLSVKINKNNQEKTIKNFCKDSLTNISKFISSMDEHRDRTRAIHHDFIEFVELELNVYGRNREHLVYITKENIRQEIRDLYNDIAINIVRVKQNLENFYRVNNLVNNTPVETAEHNSYKAAAHDHLNTAQNNCDKLVSLNVNCKNIIDKL